MRVRLIGIIDDHEGVREAISSLVRSAGYESATFPSAESFLSSGRVHEMGCVIVDYQLVALDGLELHRVLVQSGRAIPVILVSANADEVLVRALQQGVIAVLAKPFDAAALLRVIEFALLR